MSLDLNGRPFPRARNTDPLTSHQAAEQIDFDGKHYARILAALDEPGIVSEIAMRTGLSEAQVNKRLPELARSGLVRVALADGVPLVRPGLMKRLQRVWERC